MRTVDEKGTGPAIEDLLQDIDRFVGIDVEAVRLPDPLGEKIRADEPDALLEF
jgi:hypothetical protein